MEGRDNRIKYLNELENMSVEAPNIQGWDVVNAFEKPIGKVSNVLIDTSQQKVRYLDVELNKKTAHQQSEAIKNPRINDLDDNVNMLLPIGTVRMDEQNRRIVSDEINQNIIDRGPLHRKGDKISTEYERNVVGLIKEADSGKPSATFIQNSGPVNDEFYEGSYFDTERFYNRR